MRIGFVMAAVSSRYSSIQQPHHVAHTPTRPHLSTYHFEYKGCTTLKLAGSEKTVFIPDPSAAIPLEPSPAVVAGAPSLLLLCPASFISPSSAVFSAMAALTACSAAAFAAAGSPDVEEAVVVDGV